MTPADQHDSTASGGTPAPFEATARRGFFSRVLAGAISAVLGIVPVGIGLGFFFDPLIRKSRLGSETSDGGDPSDSGKDADGFIPLSISVDDLPADGTPIAHKVLDDRVDAWNRFSQIEVGTIWLRQISPGQVIAFSSICPHLGCAVDYRKGSQDFFCPCHTSSFDLDGAETNEIPPRPLDRLETRLKDETGNQIWLKYEKFRGNSHEKIAIS